MHWNVTPYAKLHLDDLYALLALRQRVFVVEQNCPFLDADGLDALALHVLCSRDDGTGRDGRGLVATTRLFDPGVLHPEAAISRVVTAPEVRRTGLGRELMRRSVDALVARHGPVAIRVDAQTYLIRFYESFGFVNERDDYVEDGIPHVHMTRPA